MPRARAASIIRGAMSIPARRPPREVLERLAHKAGRSRGRVCARAGVSLGSTRSASCRRCQMRAYWSFSSIGGRRRSAREIVEQAAHVSGRTALSPRFSSNIAFKRLSRASKEAELAEARGRSCVTASSKRFIAASVLARLFQLWRAGMIASAMSNLAARFIAPPSRRRSRRFDRASTKPGLLRALRRTQRPRTLDAALAHQEHALGIGAVRKARIAPRKVSSTPPPVSRRLGQTGHARQGRVVDLMASSTRSSASKVLPRLFQVIGWFGSMREAVERRERLLERDHLKRAVARLANASMSPA